MPNEFLLALDNWIYSAKSNRRYRFDPHGNFKSDVTFFRGQWGIAQDDFGRLFYNFNSDQLRADLLPSAALSRNPNFKARDGINAQVAADQRVFPNRVTPGVGRGYREGELIDGKLAQFAAACGPMIYRGDLFPAEFRGSSFVAEPAANLILEDGVPARIGALRELVSANSRSAWHQVAILKAIAERSRPVRVPAEPPGLAMRAAFEGAPVREIATKAAANLVLAGPSELGGRDRTSSAHSKRGGVCRCWENSLPLGVCRVPSAPRLKAWRGRLQRWQIRPG